MTTLEKSDPFRLREVNSETKSYLDGLKIGLELGSRSKKEQVESMLIMLDNIEMAKAEAFVYKLYSHSLIVSDPVEAEQGLI